MWKKLKKLFNFDFEVAELFKDKDNPEGYIAITRRKKK